MLAMILQLYLIIPLRTYASSTDSFISNSTIASTNATASIEAFLTNATTTDPMAAPPPSSFLARHTIHLLQDGALGFLYARVIARLVMRSRNSLPATAFRQITRNGYTNPDVRLATRAFVLPTVLLLAVLLLGPLLAAGIVNTLLLHTILPSQITDSMRTKLYRYSYPVCASQVLTLWAGWECVKASRRWRNRIKDEVYLVGERLHNFGEKKPPEGSKSISRKERQNG